MRRIAIVTGTRADYGLLKYLVAAVEADPRAELALIVAGSHLSAAHGMTVDEIVADGIPIAARVPLWSGDDSALAAAVDTAGAVAAYARVLDDLAPDVVVVLGDRLEAMAMALAATVIGVPVAHIHGGELTEGAMDDALRHAITKLSYLHFTSTAEHRDRVIQLGEEPERVFDLGAPVLDAIDALDLLDATQLRERFGVTVDHRTMLLTFHPASFDAGESSVALLRELLAAIDATPGTTVVVTGTNSDIGSDEIRAELSAFVASHENAAYVESFGQLGYLSAMSLAGLVLGNSSSTVLEAPLLGVPSVVVGDRQRGRPLSASVLHPAPTSSAIADAIARGFDPEFRSAAAASGSIFGTPGFAGRALEVLVGSDIPVHPRKRFHDLQPHERTTHA